MVDEETGLKPAKQLFFYKNATWDRKYHKSMIGEPLYPYEEEMVIAYCRTAGLGNKFYNP